MANRIYYTPQISLPNAVKFADCKPNVVTSEYKLAVAYHVENYIPRSAWKRWDKGPLLPPFLLQSNVNGTTVSYTIFFNEFSGSSCPEYNCNLQCTTQNVLLTQGGNAVTDTTFCVNGDRPIYHFDVEFSTEGDILALPAQFSFTFTDQLNNEAIVNVDSIKNIKPAPPLVGAKVDASNSAVCYVAVIFQTSEFNDINSDSIEKYTIQRCDWPSRTNVRTFTGYWNIPARDNMFTDRALSANQEIAYRVRFKNKWGEESLFSEWARGYADGMVS